MNYIKNKIAALKYKVSSKYKRSYSQCGEDIIIGRVLRDMNISKPFYIDIGANDPVVFSNTFLFYKQGSYGICVEPNPSLATCIAKRRPRDTVLNIGVGIKDDVRDFYIMSNDSLSTFSQPEAQMDINRGHTITHTLSIQIQTINKVIATAKNDIDILSLDIEGLDKVVLETLDFKNSRPKVICVETRSFGITDDDAYINLLTFMKKNGYGLVGYTPVNSIYADLSIAKNKQ